MQKTQWAQALFPLLGQFTTVHSTPFVAQI